MHRRLPDLHAAVFEQGSHMPQHLTRSNSPQGFRSSLPCILAGILQKRYQMARCPDGLKGPQGRCARTPNLTARVLEMEQKDIHSRSVLDLPQGPRRRFSNEIVVSLHGLCNQRYGICIPQFSEDLEQDPLHSPVLLGVAAHHRLQVPGAQPDESATRRLLYRLIKVSELLAQQRNVPFLSDGPQAPDRRFANVRFVDPEGGSDNAFDIDSHALQAIENPSRFILLNLAQSGQCSLQDHFVVAFELIDQEVDLAGITYVAEGLDHHVMDPFILCKDIQQSGNGFPGL